MLLEEGVDGSWLDWLHRLNLLVLLSVSVVFVSLLLNELIQLT